MGKQVCALALVLVVAGNAYAAIGSSEAARLAAGAQVVNDIKTDIPPDVWSKANCVVVMPDVKKAAFIFGGEYGKGIMSCRSGERWSPPVFMQLAKGSWGFQAGAEEVDLVLLVMNEQGVQKLLQNKVTLGADASIAAGPLGRQGSVATDAALTAEILAYSRAKGTLRRHQPLWWRPPAGRGCQHLGLRQGRVAEDDSRRHRHLGSARGHRLSTRARVTVHHVQRLRGRSSHAVSDGAGGSAHDDDADHGRRPESEGCGPSADARSDPGGHDAGARRHERYGWRLFRRQRHRRPRSLAATPATARRDDGGAQ
jgi:lipid-binding SYLF domain-containing protein